MVSTLCASCIFLTIRSRVYFTRIASIDHNEKDGSIYILPKCIAGMKEKMTEKMTRKTITVIKFKQKKENNLLSYACPSTDFNLLFKLIAYMIYLLQIQLTVSTSIFPLIFIDRFFYDYPNFLFLHPFYYTGLCITLYYGVIFLYRLFFLCTLLHMY